MKELSMLEIESVFGGECGPMTTGDKVEGAVVFAFTGLIGLAIWYRSYTNACA